MSKQLINKNNHMGLDMGLYMALVTRADWASVAEDGRPACTERGYIRGYLHSGVQQHRLAPKKGELDLWTVVVESNGSLVCIRADLIVGAVQLAEPKPYEETDEVLTPPDVAQPPAQRAPRQRAKAKPVAVAPAPAPAPRKPAARKPAAK